VTRPKTASLQSLLGLSKCGVLVLNEFENTESTKTTIRVAPKRLSHSAGPKIVVIDSDLGQSGASAADREGFQRLVTEVGLGRAGIVLGLKSHGKRL
jgi:DNA invertase Pin-like site-specific DNA recombinase